MNPIERLPDKHTKIFRTLCEMLCDRGYELPPKLKDLQSLENGHKDIRHFFENGDSPLFVCHKPDNKKDEMVVFYNVSDKASKKEIEEYSITMADMLKKNKRLVGMAIYRQITSQASEILHQTGRFHTFSEKEMLFNVTKHKLVPKHEALTEEEAAAVRKKHFGGKFQMIYTTDPVVKYFGWPVGTMVRIHRTMAGPQDAYIHYRVVVS